MKEIVRTSEFDLRRKILHSPEEYKSPLFVEFKNSALETREQMIKLVGPTHLIPDDPYQLACAAIEIYARRDYTVTGMPRAFIEGITILQKKQDRDLLIQSAKTVADMATFDPEIIPKGGVIHGIGNDEITIGKAKLNLPIKLDKILDIGPGLEGMRTMDGKKSTTMIESNPFIAKVLEDFAQLNNLSGVQLLNTDMLTGTSNLVDTTQFDCAIFTFLHQTEGQTLKQSLENAFTMLNQNGILVIAGSDKPQHGHLSWTNMKGYVKPFIENHQGATFREQYIPQVQGHTLIIQKN